MELSLCIPGGFVECDPSAFELNVHLLTESADPNVAIHETDSGGEAVEPGLLRPVGASRQNRDTPDTE